MLDQPEQQLDGVATACAQYIRMSREHQRFSPENQRAAIAEYAEGRGLRIVKTYEDDGRSGLNLKGRAGLKRLLQDVIAGQTDFTTILVLDVSRWGRFQDIDQAAHYEYICREAGIAVHYCGEPFENDGSSTSTILKHMKRVMAAEFSRELGKKVFASQIRGAERGFKQGGTAPFGLRRLIIDENGSPCRVLSAGQRKSLQTDRVVLIPGPQLELQAVRQIFIWFTRDGFGFNEIARRLMLCGHTFPSGARISNVQVGRILRNEIYLGLYTYNKTSQQLRGEYKHNKPSDWVRSKMFDPIVSSEIFEAANAKLSGRKKPRYARETLLSNLRRIAAEKGTISFALVAADKSGPSVACYYKRFGTLTKALMEAGITIPVRERVRPIDIRYPREVIIRALKRLLNDHGYISPTLINEDPGLPSSASVKDRLGSLTSAYCAAGWSVDMKEAKIAACKRRWAAVHTSNKV